ncbi:hypothetical protein A4244_18525 [Bacillus badius]|nr:hypothetical protein A4244_18525 [Bacillus badius]OCS85103.1 hypothetical protein A6M11_18540 [Bacillus badius]OVE46749.1 hypothetical protein B1A98_19175 [Bacillus badius]
MLLYLIAIFLCIGSWYYYSWIQKKEKGLFPFILILLAVPFLYLMVGLSIAASMYGQGGAFTSAFLAILLLANSLTILIVCIYFLCRRRVHKTNSN